ncbi:hypothetical protein [Streptomyces sp. NPDC127197]|uniref:hypothetical protein n=1 Tax=Streptomyces sp. NPDC127197 TaxID=3345388 RepID=UPI00362A4308
MSIQPRAPLGRASRRRRRLGEGRLPHWTDQLTVTVTGDGTATTRGARSGPGIRSGRQA